MPVLIEGFPAGPWGTNCWVIAPGPGSDAIVVDPGFEAASPLRDLLADQNLRAVAVVLTHGHMDHVWSVIPVCEEYAVPAFIHGADVERLVDPQKFMSTQLREAILASTGGELTCAEPQDVRTLGDGEKFAIAGIDLTPMHTPGHTPGSVVFEVATIGQRAEHLITGDVLFNNGIGRTDLVGGDSVAMARSLAKMMTTYDDGLLVFPGHGDVTTIGDERRRSKFLRAAMAEGLSASAVDAALAGAGA